MPVVFNTEIRPLSQAEFGRVAYSVINQVFALHQDLGRFFDEDIYRDALALRCSGAETEVQIEVRFDDFVKLYFIDLLVDGGAPFELKTSNELILRHRSQILNYLMLTGLSHGKLINLRPESVQHEFVNTHATHSTRRTFASSFSDWHEPESDRGLLRVWFSRFVEDVGTGLDQHLYAAAVAHFFGGEEQTVRTVEITSDGCCVGSQKIGLTDADWAFKVTTIHESGFKLFEEHLRRFLSHTRLHGAHWINVGRGRVTFRTVRK